MAYYIILQQTQQILKQEFPTPERAQSFLDNNEYRDGIVVDEQQLQYYLRSVEEWKQAQQEQQLLQEQYQREQELGPDQTEYEYLEQNKRQNDYNREKRLLFIPKRETPLHSQPAFNQRPVGHSYHKEAVNLPAMQLPKSRNSIFWKQPFGRRY